MFTAGRILRRKEWAATSDQWETAAADRERRKFRCYVPFVRQSVVATVAGFVVMATGVGFCIASFNSANQSQGPQPQTESSNDTEVFIKYFSAETYLGGLWR